MDGMKEAFATFIENFNWNGPETFALFGVLTFGLLRKWLLVALVLIVVVVGTNIENYVQFEYFFNDVTVTAPLIVYVVGSVIIAVAAFLSLFGR